MPPTLLLRASTRLRPTAPRSGQPARRAGPRPRRPRSALAGMVAAQFVDGFGARFNGLIIVLYALKAGGLTAFSGVIAVAMLGSVVAALASAVAVSRLGGRGTMRTAAVGLSITRVGSYAAILTGLPLPVLFATRFFGSISGTVLTMSAKSVAPRTGQAAASLAWLNVANGAGQAVAAAGAGVLTAFAPAGLVALVGVTIGTAATLPMLRVADRAAPTVVPVRRQVDALRVAGPIIVFGTLVSMVGMTLLALSDALVVQLASETWLGAGSAAAFTGSFAAAALLRTRPGLAWRDPKTAWPTVALGGLLVWQIAPFHGLTLLAALLGAGFAAQLLAAMIENQVIEHVGPETAASALSASGAVASLSSAVAMLVVPRMVAEIGINATAAGLAVVAGCLLVWGIVSSSPAVRSAVQSAVDPVAEPAASPAT